MGFKSGLKAGQSLISLIFISLINCWVASLICAGTLFLTKIKFLCTTLLVSVSFTFKILMQSSLFIFFNKEVDTDLFIYANTTPCINFSFRFHYRYTTEISKVHLRDELWFLSGDQNTLFVEKGHQKQSEVGM